MRLTTTVLVGTAVLAPQAIAYFPCAEVSTQVRVSQTVAVEVGFARGLICDDLSVVRAEMRERNASDNVLVLTGLRRGTTQCRAGTVEELPCVLVKVDVR